jgi:hypothetical protein
MTVLLLELVDVLKMKAIRGEWGDQAENLVTSPKGSGAEVSHLHERSHRDKGSCRILGPIVAVHSNKFESQPRGGERCWDCRGDPRLAVTRCISPSSGEQQINSNQARQHCQHPRPLL